MIFIRLFSESFRFAWHALTQNRLRTFLSLLGVTIGILAIISVFTVVDSLESNVRDSVDKLGSDVIYIQKWPWGAGEGGEYKWWEFWKRPEVELDEMEALEDKCQEVDAFAFMMSASRTAKYESNSVSNVAVMAVSYDWSTIRDFDLIDGRYFTEGEMAAARNYVLIGADVAMALYGSVQAAGMDVKLGGKKQRVIGVFEKEGEDITGNSLDQAVVMPVKYGRTLMNPRYSSPMIIAKAKETTDVKELKDELRGVMRSIRRLSPKMSDNFALNEISVINNALDGVFSAIGMAGWLIGGFSILVGGFGIANIMFVSVKERTKLIGIQKALGAKNNFILIQFLLESVMLCLVGGAVGLLLVFVGAKAVSSAMDFTIFLSFENILLGFFVSFLIGVISGIVPALSAARLDPVEAIRR